MKQPYAYPLRIDNVVSEKIKIIAKENGRSYNKEIEAGLKVYIKSFEDINGKINIETVENTNE